MNTEHEEERTESPAEALGRKLVDLKGALRQLEADPDDGKARTALHRLVHQMRGSAATLGYELVGDIASEMHAVLPSTGERIEQDALDRLAAAAHEIESSLEQNPSTIEEGTSIRVIDRGTGIGAGIERFARQRPWKVDIVADLQPTAPGDEFDLLVLIGDARTPWTPSEVSEIAKHLPHHPIALIQPFASTADRVLMTKSGATFTLGTTRMREVGELLDALLPSRRSDRGTVLIVDDDTVFRGALITVLGALGWQVQGLGDSGLFFETLERDRPDVVVIDMEMPAPDGLELVRALRASEEWHCLPAIIVTGHQDEHRIQAYEAGASLVLDKAAPLGQFRTRLLDGLRRLDQPRPSTRLGRASSPTAAASSSPLGDVVIIEDDETLLQMLEYALRNEGRTCSTFTNGRKAVEELLEADTGTRAPIIILDVDLPGVDGFTILQELEQARPGCYQVIVTTVHSSEREQVKALRSGAVDYVVKPISVPVLLAKVEQLLKRGALP